MFILVFVDIFILANFCRDRNGFNPQTWDDKKIVAKIDFPFKLKL